jgi:hypothetical protein
LDLGTGSSSLDQDLLLAIDPWRIWNLFCL